MMARETVTINGKTYEVVKVSPTDFMWLDPTVTMPTDEEIAEWWEARKATRHTEELSRTDAEEFTEYLDDIGVMYSAQAAGFWVTVTYYANEELRKKIADFIQWMNSDERYSYHSGDSWDA